MAVASAHSPSLAHRHLARGQPSRAMGLLLTSPSAPLPPFCSRGIALQRDDIPMRPSLDYPTESEVELELPAPPEEKEEGK